VAVGKHRMLRSIARRVAHPQFAQHQVAVGGQPLPVARAPARREPGAIIEESDTGISLRHPGQCAVEYIQTLGDIGQLNRIVPAVQVIRPIGIVEYPDQHDADLWMVPAQ
jgi:hypothetical protein